jgi:hypothetical protein
MRILAGVTRGRLLALVLVITTVLVGAWLWFGDGDVDSAEVVGDHATSARKTVEYRGVQVDIPASWEPLNMDDCEFQYEAWAPPVVDGCDWAGGMAFYGSATFDPADGPGIKRVVSRDEPEWGGYTYAGDLAIYASTDDREVAERVLQSAH